MGIRRGTEMKKELHFDLEVWYCRSCNKYFYTDRENRDDEDGFVCPYCCCGELEYKGRFEVSGSKREE